ncbi:ATP-binding protein [Actinomadura hibisca]|uniref:ATP-binding protein n=1 Tax=Actinomadura hibisca TaxID=68565 RepID=UPI000A5EE138|nr:ATP-binding protein [Actinomadura hibisca]
MIIKEELRPPESITEPSVLVIYAEPQSVRAARGFVGRWFEDHAMSASEDDAVTAVSEMVTNAFKHACAPGEKIELCVYRSAPGVVIEVLDPSSELPVIKPFDLTSEDGRGLAMLSLLAARWGTYTRLAGGKCVWAVIA